MNNLNNLFRILFFLILINMYNCYLHGTTHCKNPLSEEFIKKQCDLIISDFQVDTNPEVVTEKIISSVLAKVNLGDKGTFGLNDSYIVSRIQVELFCESDQKLFLKKLIDIGDGVEREDILTKACQKNDNDKPGDYYGTFSVQIFLKEIEEDKIQISADKKIINADESTTISVSVTRAGCPVKDKLITLKRSGPGSLPDKAITDENGRAEVLFRAEEEGETKIEAIFQDQATKITIVTQDNLMWDMECNIHYYQYHPKFPYRNAGYNDKWRSKVQFQNIPLSQLANSDFTDGYPESSEGPENIKLYLKWLKIKKQYVNEGSFYDSEFTVYDGAELHYGKPEGNPIWTMGVGVQGEKLDFMKEREKELQMFIMVKMKSRSVLVYISEKAGVGSSWPLRFELRIKFPKEQIIAGKPFILDLKEPHGSISHKNIKIKFTPKKVNNN